MQKIKTHNFLVRGVEKGIKNRLKKKAIKNKRSVNQEILMALDNHVADITPLPLEEVKELQTA